MHPEIQKRIDQLLEVSRDPSKEPKVSQHQIRQMRNDGLSQAIRTQQDADLFMAEVRFLVEQTEK